MPRTAERDQTRRTATEAANPDDPRITAAGLLFEVSHALKRKLDPDLEAVGLAGPEFEVLLRLTRSDEHSLRMADLAQQVGLSASGVTRLVDRLVARDLVERRSCPEDGRVAYAVLTPAGQDLATEVLPAHGTAIERWFTGLLEPDQLDQLTAALRIVRAEVHPGAEQGATPSVER